MGRAASKFEGLEDLLGSVVRGIDRAGRQAVAAQGTVRLKLSQPCHALPVDADRLRFVGGFEASTRLSSWTMSHGACTSAHQITYQIFADAQVPRQSERPLESGCSPEVSRCLQAARVGFSE